MLVVIPSKNRAGKITSHKVIKSAKIYVSSSEFHIYNNIYDNVISIPKEIEGITSTRNWILKNTNEKYVIFIDDDVKSQGYIKLYNEKTKKISMLENEWINEWQKLFDITEQMNYKIFGVSTDGQPCSVYPYKPFLFRSYVTASCMGIINDGTYYFDEKYIVKEDYELCLRHIKERDGILCARYLFWQNSHWNDNGGCKDYRTQNIELNAIKMLLKDYKGYIRRIERKGSNYCVRLDF